MKNIFCNKKIIIAVVFAMAICIRVIPQIVQNIDVNCDEAMLAINAKSIAETGKDIYGTSNPVYFEAWGAAGQSALPTYLSALLVKIFGYSLFTVRLPFIILSICSLFIVFALSKKMFGTRTAVIILALTAISPWHILQSQIALDCNMFPHILLIGVYLLYVGLEEKRNICTYFSMFFFAISMYCYGVAIFIVPLMLTIISTYELIKKKIGIKQVLICILIYVVISIPILLMFIVNYFKMDSINLLGITIQRFYYSLRETDILFFSKNIVEQFVSNVFQITKLIVIQNDKLPWNQIPGFGAIYLCSIVFAVIGLVSLIKKQNNNKTRAIIIVSWIIVSFVVGLIINDTNINRLNVIWYALIIIAGYGIALCSKKNYIKAAIAVMYAILFSLFMYKLIFCFPGEVKKSFTFSAGLVDACEYINGLNCESIVFSNEVYNTDKEFVFIKFKLDQKTNNPIDRFNILRYYGFGTSMNSCLDDYTKKITINTINDNSILEDEVYLMSTNEKNKIKNANEYEIKEFYKYCVLEKKK